MQQIGEQLRPSAISSFGEETWSNAQIILADEVHLAPGPEQLAMASLYRGHLSVTRFRLDTNGSKVQKFAISHTISGLVKVILEGLTNHVDDNFLGLVRKELKRYILLVDGKEEATRDAAIPLNEWTRILYAIAHYIEAKLTVHLSRPSTVFRTTPDTFSLAGKLVSIAISLYEGALQSRWAKVDQNAAICQVLFAALVVPTDADIERNSLFKEFRPKA
jgi:hypothetical protein